MKWKMYVNSLQTSHLDKEILAIFTDAVFD